MTSCARQTALGRSRMRTNGHDRAIIAYSFACPSQLGPAFYTGASPLATIAQPAAPRKCISSWSDSKLNRPVLCRSVPAAEPLATISPDPRRQSSSGPDFTLHCPETGTAIHVFGVEHLEPQPHIGEWIIRHRPQAVVVETSMGPEHGAQTGNVIRCGDRVADPTAAFYLRMFCQIGVTLQEFKDGDFTESPLWNQVRCSYNGEQLAYIAAFATGAPLVFGDRPKGVTYRRLFGLTTIPQLDQGFSYAAVQNYRAFLGLSPLPYDPENLPVTEQIMMQEREAVMLHVIHALCRNALLPPPQPPPGGPPSPEGSAPASLALVVGSAHLPGLEYLWRSGSAPQYGLRRGLMEAMLRLSVTKE
ncbi:hypothetical protein VOLCADRAFT_121785, partial [Volvox carteri f. nagariensis]